MNTVEITRPSLLLRIRDHRDEAAWAEFVQLYTPLIFRFARKSGLQETDASTVAQDVLVTVARRIKSFDYDRANGSFRNWLKVVTRSRLSDFVRAENRHVAGSGDTAVQAAIEQQPESDLRDLWEQEYRRSLFEWVANRIRDDFESSTWQAFWQTSVEERETAVVAEELGISVGAVYIARSRVLARLRKEVQETEDFYDEARSV